MPFNREAVLERLRTFPSTRLVFIKLNGEEREMEATLNSTELHKFVGAVDVKAVASVDTPGAARFEDDLIAVFDLGAEGFRSFYLQNLVTIEGVKPEDESPDL